MFHVSSYIIYIKFSSLAFPQEDQKCNRVKTANCQLKEGDGQHDGEVTVTHPGSSVTVLTDNGEDTRGYYDQQQRQCQKVHLQHF